MKTKTQPPVGSSDLSGDLCLICGKPVENYDPKLCCSGFECGCRGQPTEPCICSGECYDALMVGTGKPYDQRRKDAGIALWSPNVMR